jgi:molybdopterin-guanine dinucleotide biosynthesis protein A
MKYTIPAVIFAGGRSSRMGTDKALLPFAGYTSLSEFQYNKVSQWFKTVYLSSKSNKFNFNCPILKDIYKESSPLVGIASIFQILKTDAVFILSVDAPLVNRYVIDKLWEAYTHDTHANTSAIIAQSPNGLQPLCGIYKRSILPFVLQNISLNKHRLSSLLRDTPSKTVFFEDDTPFTNLNTQEEYQKLLTSHTLFTHQKDS